MLKRCTGGEPYILALEICSTLSGNHALALSYHGQQLNIPVTVVMPVFAPLMKIGMCRSYGATVVLKGDNIGKVGPTKASAPRMWLQYNTQL